MVDKSSLTDTTRFLGRRCRVSLSSTAYRGCGGRNRHHRGPTAGDAGDGSKAGSWGLLTKLMGHLFKAKASTFTKV